MKTTQNLGIWMDYSVAQLIDLNTQKNNQSITSDFTFNVKEATLKRSENIMQNKEQQMHQAYYKEIANEILKYDHVLLFGPTNAKIELHNYLNKDLHFKDIKIDVESADKMTDNEKFAFAKNHFKL
jgi:hypothetical protein